jgi:3',5'-cyclic AMP phosphodiesterase CpdA
VRILHFSDIHVDVSLRRIPLRDWLGKRVLGGANHVLRRGRDFRRAREKLAALGRFAEEHRVEVAICTGDYTILGTDVELEAAREAVDPVTRLPLVYITVPGNHDVYLPDSVRERRFEKYFGEFFRNDLPEHASPDGWPQVRLIGERVAVVTVRSARPNPQPWLSSGMVGPGELDALARVLRDPRVAERFVIVATHYALRRPDGSPDGFLHRLENADALQSVIAEVPRGCLLHGHIHRRFWLRLPGVRPAILGAGSATHEGHEGFWMLEIDAGGGVATPGWFDGAGYRLDTRAAVPVP